MADQLSKFDKIRRQLLWQMPVGLYLIGAIHEANASIMTISFATQVSTAPKKLALGFEKDSHTLSISKNAGKCSFMFLEKDQKELARKFAKKPAFDSEKATLNGYKFFLTEKLRVLVLESIRAYFELKITKCLDLGSHELVIAQVENAVALKEAASLDVLGIKDTRMRYGG